MAVPYAMICILQAVMFFVLTIVRRMYSDQVSKFVDTYCACGIVETEPELISKKDEEMEDSNGY